MTTKTFTLDDIKSAAEAQYGSTNFETSEGEVRLLNPLRLSKAKRDALVAAQAALGADDADQEAVLSDAIRLVAHSQTRANALLADLDGDLAALVTVFKMYSEGTQAGEASASQD